MTCRFRIFALEALTLVLVTALASVACTRPQTSSSSRDSGSSDSGLPTLDVTHWTPATELFMEYPPLVAQRKALFAVHLTKLADFSPVTDGHARLEFTPESGGAPTSLSGPPPSRPGAFRVEEIPPAPGRYRWALVLESPALTDRHDLGTITVFPDEAAAKREAGGAPAENAAAIAYLKEQQWTNPFATAPVQRADLRQSIRVPATVHPLPGGEALVAAPAAGRFRADRIVSIGDRVRAGQLLGYLEPRLGPGLDRATLTSDAAEARVAVEAARAELARSERLLAEQAVPARRVEEARRALTVADARLTAAEARLSQRDETLRSGGGSAGGNAFALRAPLDGRIADTMVTLGAAYEEGAPLFRIVRTDRVELEVQVPAPDVPEARAATGVAFDIPGLPEPVALEPHHVHDAGVIDPTTRALPLQMEVENPGGRLLVGQSGTALLFTRQTVQVPTVPAAAVLMEAGRPYVFVQEGGEQFARRFIEIAVCDGDRVGIRSGVTTGERVVTRGAYDIQLASAAKGLPAEGHVH